MSRILAVDPGSRRIGIAVSDESATIALPERTVDTGPRALEEVAAVARERGVEAIVVGLPRNMDGSEGPQAVLAREVGGQLGRLTGLPIDFWDERLTSMQAEREMAAAGISSRKRRGKVDPVAATLILQGYLDRRTHREMKR